LPVAGRAAAQRAEFGGKPLFEFEGNSAGSSNLINHFRQEIEGNTGAKSAGENAAA
jgi:hypothetical protein